MTHQIKVKIPKQEIINKDMEITIFNDEKKLGTLKISRGSIVWTPSGHSVNHFDLTWENFDELMKKQK